MYRQDVLKGGTLQNALYGGGTTGVGRTVSSGSSQIRKYMKAHGSWCHRRRYKIHRSGKWDYDVVSAYGSENRQAGHRVERGDRLVMEAR
jgi:hypothetical protein